MLSRDPGHAPRRGAPGAARVGAAAPTGQPIVTDRAGAAAESSSPELVTWGVWHLKWLPGVLVHAPVLPAMGA